MAIKKTVYVHFERPAYIMGKSEFLKVQMEILYLKKILKNLSITRQKKIQYQQMVQELFRDLKESIIKLEILMPEEDISGMEIKRVIKGKNRTNIKNKSVSNSPFIKNISTLDVKKDDIEEELLKIKEKLNSLNIY